MQMLSVVILGFLPLKFCWGTVLLLFFLSFWGIVTFTFYRKIYKNDRAKVFASTTNWLYFYYFDIRINIVKLIYILTP